MKGYAHHTMSVRLSIITGVLCLALTGCGMFSGDKEDIENFDQDQKSVIELYNTAKDNLEKESYETAAAGFEDVERQYPYSTWATKSILMAAYALYKDLEYNRAIATLDRFIELHPGHKDVSYAYYIKALCYYEQVVDVGRDQATTESAKKTFEEIVRRFPESKYARDARLKLDFVNDHLAGKEMNIGRFYLKRGLYPAAIRRFANVVRDYETTTHVPEALHRLVESYHALGVDQTAVKITAVLGYNYPGSDWYQASYALMKGQSIPELQGPEGTWGQLKKYVGID